MNSEYDRIVTPTSRSEDRVDSNFRPVFIRNYRTEPDQRNLEILIKASLQRGEPWITSFSMGHRD